MKEKKERKQTGEEQEDKTKKTKWTKCDEIGIKGEVDKVPMYKRQQT